MYKINLLISCSKNIDNRLLVGVEVKDWILYIYIYIYIYI